MTNYKITLLTLIMVFSHEILFCQNAIINSVPYMPKHSKKTNEEINNYLRETTTCLKASEEYSFQFNVELDGSISDIQQTKGPIGKDCAYFIKLSFGTAGQWIPGKDIDREPVRVRMTLNLPAIKSAELSTFTIENKQNNVSQKLSSIPANTYDIKFNSNIKIFRNIIATNNSLFSLVYSPPSGAIPDLQRSKIGHFLIETKVDSKLTDYAVFENRGNDNKENFNSYNLNNNLTELNKLYRIKFNQKTVTFSEMTLDLINNNILTNEKFETSNQFELNSEGNIETFNIISGRIGNGIGAFTAYSTFNAKAFLFLYKYKTASPYVKIDLGSLSNGFYSHSNNPRYKGMIDGREFESHVQIEEVIQNNKYVFVFLRLFNSDKVVPIKIDLKTNISKAMFESVFNKGQCRTQEFSDAYVCSDGFFYLPVSQGFANYYSVDGNVKIVCFDSDLKKSWETNLYDITINNVYESGNFIIVGGFTTSKGYIGYPNPKIMVINKQTRAIAYEKVLAKKNGEIDCISSDNNGSIIIGIGSYCCKTKDTDSDFKPQIIIDKLNANGLFENDLFNKQ